MNRHENFAIGHYRQPHLALEHRMRLEKARRKTHNLRVSNLDDSAFILLLTFCLAHGILPNEYIHRLLHIYEPALPQLGSAAGILRLVVGHIDFVADAGLVCDEEESQLAPLRFAVNIATRLHRLAPPIDGVTTAIGDATRLRKEVLRALRFGFAGKMCFHPAHVAVVHDAFMPTVDELAWAHKVLAADAAAGGAAVQVDGRMVDQPLVLQARRAVARAQQ